MTSWMSRPSSGGSDPPARVARILRAARVPADSALIGQPQVRADVEDAFGLPHLRAQRKSRAIAGTLVAEVGVELVQPHVPALHDLGAPAESVVHEEAADHVAPVAEPARGHLVRQQEEARVLDSAAREDVDPCPGLTGLPLERPEVHVRDVRAVLGRLEVRRVGVHQQQQSRVPFELVPVDPAKAHGGRVVEEELCQPPRRDGHRLPVDERPEPPVEHAVLEPADRERAGVVGVELGPRDRPSAVGDPRLRGEVVLVQRRAQARPVVRRPSQKAKTRECVRPGAGVRRSRRRRAAGPRLRIRRPRPRSGRSSVRRR